MIKCDELFNIFKKYDLIFFTGVPDSTFNGWMSFLDEANNKNILTNRIVVNEGDGIHHAGAYNIATGKFCVVYMQNAGLGNTINPITSYADSEVYSIPMLLMIGFRGEPGANDEPQHKKMGKITTKLLETLGMPYEILPDDIDKVKKSIETAVKFMKDKSTPYALIIKRGIIDNYKKEEEIQEYDMLREEALTLIADELGANDVVISTTGKTSRELFEYREFRNEGHGKDFLNVGGMGGAGSQALEIALQKPNRKVFVFDGDGALLMHAGILATIGYYKPKNFFHIVFDNESHESTGGQPTVSKGLDFSKIAKSCGYKNTCQIKTRNELMIKLRDIQKENGPQMMVIKVRRGSRNNLGRPTTTPIENKEKFIENLR